jgi:Mlc titration factor MtfA (ptsG expression regulator)
LALIIISIIATLCWCYIVWGKAYLVEHRRQRAQAIPLTAEQTQVIEQAMPLYRRLPKSLRAQLDGHIQVFLAEKSFCAGDDLTITADMRLVVAANACLLLLNRHSNYFINVKTIVLYTGAYRACQLSQNGDVVGNVEQVRLGESWPWGTIVLSWSDSLAGSINERDGQNVILHEFAHQLDQQNGGATGTPKLKNKNMYKQWHGIFSQEYFELKAQVSHHQTGVIDGYGAVNEAEFFAVVTESFFERPLELRQQHASLYEILYRYYQVDPASWFK